MISRFETVMKARTETKEKIIALGTDLVKSVGYPSLSYQQISSQLGIKNAAVHYHYPSKENLGLEILISACDSFNGFITYITDLSPWEKLELFFENYRKSLESDHQICLIGASASDYHQIPESMQAAAKDYMVLVKNWFIDLLETGRKEGHFVFKGEPVNKASLMIAAMAGGLQQARLIGDDHYDGIINQIRTELRP